MSASSEVDDTSVEEEGEAYSSPDKVPLVVVAVDTASSSSCVPDCASSVLHRQVVQRHIVALGEDTMNKQVGEPEDIASWVDDDVDTSEPERVPNLKVQAVVEPDSNEGVAHMVAFPLKKRLVPVLLFLLP